jgi:hypothetical protein
LLSAGDPGPVVAESNLSSQLRLLRLELLLMNLLRQDMQQLLNLMELLRDHLKQLLNTVKLLL